MNSWLLIKEDYNFFLSLKGSINPPYTYTQPIVKLWTEPIKWANMFNQRETVLKAFRNESSQPSVIQDMRVSAKFTH